MSEVNRVEALVAKYETLKAQYDELDGATKEAKKQADAAKAEVVRAILDVAEQTGVDDLTITVGAYKYGATVKEFFGITKAEQDEAFPLLRELGMGDLITERVDNRTLSKELTEVLAAYAAEHPEEAGQFPAEYEPLLVHLSRYTKDDLTRRKA